MTEEEYLDFLDGVAVRHLHLDRIAGLASHHDRAKFGYTAASRRGLGGSCSDRVNAEFTSGVLHDLIWVLRTSNRLVWITWRRVDNLHLVRGLGFELTRLAREQMAEAREFMKEAGVLEALDKEGTLVFGNMTMGAVPPEDVEYLSLSDEHGRSPEGQAQDAIAYARSRLQCAEVRASRIVDQGVEEAERIGKLLVGQTEPLDGRAIGDSRCSRIFGGISQVLSGSIAGVGNILLGAGLFASTGPMDARYVVGSSALAVALIGKGIDDLRTVKS